MKLPERKYVVMQYKFIRGSSQNGSMAVSRLHSRKKNAAGDCKTHFLSQLDMMLTHDLYGPEIDLDEPNYAVRVYDKDGLWYETRFFVQEIHEFE